VVARVAGAVTGVVAPVTGTVTSVAGAVTGVMAPVTGAVTRVVTPVIGVVAPVNGSVPTAGGGLTVAPPAPVLNAGVPGVSVSRYRAGAVADPAVPVPPGGGAGVSWLPGSAAGAGAAVSPASALPGLPAGPGGANSPGGGSGSGSGFGGSSGGGVPGGIGAASAALLALVLLWLARHAAARPIWRAYLPEVPPA